MRGGPAPIHASSPAKRLWKTLSMNGFLYTNPFNAHKLGNEHSIEIHFLRCGVDPDLSCTVQG